MCKFCFIMGIFFANDYEKLWPYGQIFIYFFLQLPLLDLQGMLPLLNLYKYIY